jgi:hypothetical protein
MKPGVTFATVQQSTQLEILYLLSFKSIDGILNIIRCTERDEIFKVHAVIQCRIFLPSCGLSLILQVKVYKHGTLSSVLLVCDFEVSTYVGDV